MNHLTPRIAHRLRSRAALFWRKKCDHGEAYLRVGVILNAMFPEGLLIKGEQKFNELGLFVRMLDNMLKGANLRFKNGRQAARDGKISQTLDDLGVLSFLWGELIEMNTKKPSKKKSLRKLKELYRSNINHRP
jgi:hypothetical protein